MPPVLMVFATGSARVYLLLCVLPFDGGFRAARDGRDDVRHRVFCCDQHHGLLMTG
jgi:hypothetical protein